MLVERVLELRTYDLRVKNIELNLDLDPKLPETMVDANQIQQVLFNVIITDIKMPDMDGRGLYKRLREIDPSLAERTVFITGDTVSPDTRTFLEDVPNPCLAKPFRVREVRDTIGRILEARR